MSSFSIPLTGLEAASSALDTIANNLSNMNTTAFKSQTASFADLIYQQVGASGNGDPIELGGGVQVNATDTDFSGGSLNPAGSATDMAIDGNGFFIVQNGNGTTSLTRDGSFSTNANGDLVTQGGLAVMGYPAQNGVIDASSGLAPIQLPENQVESAQASSNFSLTGNLDSSAAVGATASMPVTVYDSLGQQQNVTINFTKTAANSWSYNISLPSGAATGGSGLTGTLTFNSSGNLVSPSSNVSNISFTGLSDGASSLNMTWNLFGSNQTSNMSQVATATTCSPSTTDGYASGNYTGFSVGSSGIISAQFSNGRTQAIGQVALANVSNDQGLQIEGGNLYQTTLASGNSSVGIAGTGTLGDIEGSELEGSNVNISTEFANLVVAQNSYEASSKAITTFDHVDQDTINMIS